MFEAWRWRFDSFAYWCSEHPATVLLLVAIGIFLYAAMVGLNLLREIARAARQGKII